MTIGPEPIKRILLMSSRLGISTQPAARSCRQLHEAVEQVAGIVRSGTRLRVVLDRRAGDVAQDKALHRTVVEVQVRQLRRPELRLPAHGLVPLDTGLAPRPLDREAVVLRGDLDAAGLKVLHRMVRAPMAER